MLFLFFICEPRHKRGEAISSVLKFFCYQLQFPDHRPLRRTLHRSVILFINIEPLRGSEIIVSFLTSGFHPELPTFSPFGAVSISKINSFST